MAPDSLSIRLRRARGSMSLAEASERSGVPMERIRMYEEGERHPYAKTLRRIATAYDVTVAELRKGLESATRGGGTVRPEPRRRRRRPAAAPAAPAAATPAMPATAHRVEVPVELAAGEDIRVVIELVIRARPAAQGGPVVESHVAIHPAAPAAPAVASGEGPATGTATDAEALPAVTETAAGPHGRPAAAGGTARAVARRRDGNGQRPAAPAAPVLPGDAGEPDQPSVPEARDPLDGFRRAYRDFRRDKR
jgi:transcriptional regulator with XRE-family HTH domain